jgi:hypothetical protein
MWKGRWFSLQKRLSSARHVLLHDQGTRDGIKDLAYKIPKMNTCVIESLVVNSVIVVPLSTILCSCGHDHWNKALSRISPLRVRSLVTLPWALQLMAIKGRVPMLK